MQDKQENPDQIQSHLQHQVHQDQDSEPDYERYIFGLQLTSADKKRELRRFKKEARKIKAKLKNDQDAVEEAHTRAIALVNICCPNCYKRKLLRNKGDRVSKCKSCGTVFRPLAQFQFFKNMKAPRAVMVMIDLLQVGCIFNAAQFKLEMKVSYDTSWRMMREVEIVMLHAFDGLRDIEAVDAACFSDATSRRSLTQQSINKTVRLLPEIRIKSPALQAKLRDFATCSDIEKQLYEHLSEGRRAFDELFELMDIQVSQLSSALTALELGGLIKAHPGDIYSRVQQEETGLAVDHVKTADEVVIPAQLQARAAVTTNCIKVYFHGVSEKYLALCEMNIWRFTKLREDSQSFSIFAACLTYSAPEGLNISAYHSPAKIKTTGIVSGSSADF